MTLLSRGLVTAPATGELTCRLYAIFVNHTSTRVYSRITVLAGTRLQLLYAPIDSSAQTWQVSKSLVNTAYAAARVRFTPAAGARSVRASGRPGVRAFGDVNVTVCSPVDKGACQGAGARRDAGYAYVGTQFMVRQLQANGAICRTFVNGPLVGTRISKSIHHRKINQSPVVPVSSSCTSRTFTAYVRVTTNRSANSIAVEGNHRCGTALYVRP